MIKSAFYEEQSKKTPTFPVSLWVHRFSKDERLLLAPTSPNSCWLRHSSLAGWRSSLLTLAGWQGSRREPPERTRVGSTSLLQGFSFCGVAKWAAASRELSVLWRFQLIVDAAKVTPRPPCWFTGTVVFVPRLPLHYCVNGGCCLHKVQRSLCARGIASLLRVRSDFQRMSDYYNESPTWALWSFPCNRLMFVFGSSDLQ